MLRGGHLSKEELLAAATRSFILANYYPKSARPLRLAYLLVCTRETVADFECLSCLDSETKKRLRRAIVQCGVGAGEADLLEYALGMSIFCVAVTLVVFPSFSLPWRHPC